MKLIPPGLLALVWLLVSPAHAQDYIKGFNAYLRGDFARAQQEFRPLAESGNVLAQYKLGVMYHNGEGVRQDFGEAVRWFHRAAMLGYAPAQNSVGVMYEKGRGVKRSYRDAVEWYRASAEQGYARAQYRLGRMYALGRGVQRDFTEAVVWFNIAATNGIEDAALASESVAARLTPEQLAAVERKSRDKFAKNDN